MFKIIATHKASYPLNIIVILKMGNAYCTSKNFCTSRSYIKKINKSRSKINPKSIDMHIYAFGALFISKKNIFYLCTFSIIYIYMYVGIISEL